MFSGFSSCGTLRFAPWQLPRFGRGPWSILSLVGLHVLAFWALGRDFLLFWPFGP